MGKNASGVAEARVAELEARVCGTIERADEELTFNAGDTCLLPSKIRHVE